MSREVVHFGTSSLSQLPPPYPPPHHGTVPCGGRFAVGRGCSEEEGPCVFGDLYLPTDLFLRISNKNPGLRGREYCFLCGKKMLV